MRPRRSAAPPAPNGTTTRTGRFGQSCACAAGGANAKAARAITARPMALNVLIRASHLPPRAPICYHSVKPQVVQRQATGRRDMEGEHDIARRTVLMSAGVGIGAGLVSGIATAQAEG